MLMIMLFLSISCSKNELRGTVSDGITKKPINNVSVTLVGTELSSVTNSEGKYEIIDYPKGEHTLKFSKNGYNILETQVALLNGGEFFKSIEIYKRLDGKYVESEIMNWINKYVGEIPLNKYIGELPPSGKIYRICEKHQIIDKEINDLEVKYTVVARFVIQGLSRSSSGTSFSAVFNFINTDSGWVFKNITREGKTYIDL